MSTTSHAVFLSYASEDASAAEGIAEVLRTAGIEVWFDKNALRGGDAWDRMIHEQIQACALFVPIISANAHARVEGYFRLEWKLAVDRSHRMAPDQAFLMPVVIDDTRQKDTRIPDRFRELQWTRLPAGDTSPAFVERVKRLLSPESSPAPDPAPSAGSAVAPNVPAPRVLIRRWRGVLYWVIAAAVLLAVGYFGLERLNPSKPSVASAASIAVLPLANESGEASQQYFSDGISEDLITALSQVPGLKVIGRTSAFRFRDSKEDSRSIGAKLGVAHLLEGSVRRSGEMVRVSTELINTVDGSTQWSERYDRPYKDLFALQDEISRVVAGALKTHLLPGENNSLQSDRPPSGNLEAYNAVLEGKYYHARETEADARKAIERFTLATQLDPRYGLAWSLLSEAWTELGQAFLDLGEPMQAAYAKGRAAADTALSLAPELAAAHIARGYALQSGDFDWHGAEAEYRRALELAPSDGDAKWSLAGQLAIFGQVEKAIELMREALAADPLRGEYYQALAFYLSTANHFEEAEQAIRKAIELKPGAVGYHFTLAVMEVQRGNAQAALAAAQQEIPSFYQAWALALALQIGSDRTAADAALKNMVSYSIANPYGVAEVYAIRNDADKTFAWLERAWSSRDPGISNLLTDPFIRRYRDDPRFPAFCRKVGLPVPGEVGQRT